MHRLKHFVLDITLLSLLTLARAVAFTQRMTDRSRLASTV